MALTLSGKIKTTMGSKHVVIVSCSFGTYETGGVALTAADFNLDYVDRVIADSHTGYVFQYDYSNEKLKAYYGDWNKGSDGALIESAEDNLTSAGVTDLRIIAIGRGKS